MVVKKWSGCVKKDNKNLEEIEVIDIFDELPKKVEEKKTIKR